LGWNPKGKRRICRPRYTWWRKVQNEELEKGKSWSEVNRMAGNRTSWRCFVDALCPLRDNRKWWWWLLTLQMVYVYFVFIWKTALSHHVNGTP
jgi:hypothetical protein